MKKLCQTLTQLFSFLSSTAEGNMDSELWKKETNIWLDSVVSNDAIGAISDLIQQDWSKANLKKNQIQICAILKNSCLQAFEKSHPAGIQETLRRRNIKTLSIFAAQAFFELSNEENEDEQVYIIQGMNLRAFNSGLQKV